MVDEISGIVLAGELVLHAAALDDGGRGIVFAGHSGEGKTTALCSWRGQPGARVVNQDRTALRPRGGQALACAIPWGTAGDRAVQREVVLKALLVIEKSPDSSIARLEASEALPLLAARSLLPYWDKKLAATALRNLASVLEKAPVYRLRCRPGPHIMPLVRGIL